MYQNKSRNQNNNNYNSKGKNNGNYRRLKSLRANAYQSNSNNSSNYRRLINNDANNQNKKPDDIPGTVPLLHYKGNADSNLSKWIEAIQPFLESLFGHLASFITTDTNQVHQYLQLNHGQKRLIQEESNVLSKKLKRPNMQESYRKSNPTNPKCGEK